MTAPSYPEAHTGTYYGRRVWELDEGEAVMVQDRDRRAYAALCAHARGEGITARSIRVARDVKERWVSAFADTCGCTEEQHQRHLEEDEDCIGACEHDGLPPCQPHEFAWQAEYADAPGAPALPVLVVRW